MKTKPATILTDSKFYKLADDILELLKKHGKNVFCTTGLGTDKVIIGAIAAELKLDYDDCFYSWTTIVCTEGASCYGSYYGKLDIIRLAQEQNMISSNYFYEMAWKLKDLNESFNNMEDNSENTIKMLAEAEKLLKSINKKLVKAIYKRAFTKYPHSTIQFVADNLFKKLK